MIIWGEEKSVIIWGEEKSVNKYFGFIKIVNMNSGFHHECDFNGIIKNYFEKQIKMNAE